MNPKPLSNNGITPSKTIPTVIYVNDVYTEEVAQAFNNAFKDAPNAKITTWDDLDEQDKARRPKPI